MAIKKTFLVKLRIIFELYPKFGAGNHRFPFYKLLFK